MEINGRSPINCLLNNIVFTFENANQYIKKCLSNAISAGKVNPEIEFINNTEFETPNASLTNGTISIQESFLCYLWCISYFVLFVSEELNKEQIQNGVLGGFDLSKTPERVRAFKLLGWAISIRRNWSDWDMSLPNPQLLDGLTNLENFYIPKANNIFCHGAAFILLHEFAHLQFNHSKSDGDWSHSQEKEADQYAREALVNYLKSDKDQLIGGLGIAVGAVLLLFLKADGGSLSSSTHPNIDLRVQYTYDHLNILENQGHRESIKQLICNSCVIFFQYSGIAYESIGITENIDDAFRLVLEKFDELHGFSNKP